MTKNVPKASRHIRWNYEILDEKEGLLLYHFVVVGDKRREGVMERILCQLQAPGLEVTPTRERIEMKVSGSRMIALFGSYKTLAAPRVLNLALISDNVKQDDELYEREEEYGIVQYLHNTYGLNAPAGNRTRASSLGS